MAILSNYPAQLKDYFFAQKIELRELLYRAMMPDRSLLTHFPYTRSVPAHIAALQFALRTLDLSEVASPGAQRLLSERRLVKLLKIARRAPWWKARLGSKKSIHEIQSIKKNDLRQIKKDLLVTGGPGALARMTWRRTSGTNGEPFEWGMDAVSLLRSMNPHYLRPLHYYDNALAEVESVDVLAINMPHGNEVVPYGPIRKDLVFKIGTDQQKESGALETLVKQISESRPTRVLYGYPSEFLLLAQEIERSGRSCSASIILTTGQILEESARETITRCFGAKVYSFYSSRELGPVAFECRDNLQLFHVCAERILLEILEAERGADDVFEGKIVATAYDQGAMPLIRYETGDRGTLSAKGEACTCGLTLPQLTFSGRVTDFLLLSGGRRVPARRIRSTILEQPFFEEIRRWRATQSSIDQVVLELETFDSSALSKEVESSLRARLKEKVGDIAIEFKYLSFKEVSGKFKDFIPL